LAAQAVLVEGSATPATEDAFRAVIFALANGLEHSTKAMRDAEQAVAAEKADDAPIRTKRDEAAGKLADLLIRLRSTIEDHLGADGIKTYGLAGDTSRVPRKVFEQAQNVAQLLEKAPVKLVSAFGASFDSAIAAASLTTHAIALDGLIADDDREARELEHAFAMRDRAVSDWSDMYQGTASALEGLYRRAGWKELAEKVRPTVRKMRGEEVSTDDVETPKPENG
jgi:pimeloyl-ACP methyl ester carboxylesterase